MAIDDTIRRSLLAAAGELQGTICSVPEWAIPGGVGDPDLQRAMCVAIQGQLGAVAAVDGPLPPATKECWAGWLGKADVLVKPPSGGPVYLETKLCVVDRLYEAVWDVLKVALLTALVENSVGYVVYAAPSEGWSEREDHPLGLFQDSAMTVSELLRDTYAEAWAWCLEATKTTRPLQLPNDISTFALGSARIQAPGSDWELRAVRVEGETKLGWVSFDAEGWPG